MEKDCIVRIQNLNKTFRGRAGTVTALDGVSLEIRRGEIFGIIGLSGAGKSTLVRCINFLEKPTAGTVTVDGQELGKLSKRELLEARRSMGMIFQQFNLLQQRTALQNICFPLEIAGVKKAEAEKRARELLETVGLSDRADNYPSQLSAARGDCPRAGDEPKDPAVRRGDQRARPDDHALDPRAAQGDQPNARHHDYCHHA